MAVGVRVGIPCQNQILGHLLPVGARHKGVGLTNVEPCDHPADHDRIGYESNPHFTVRHDDNGHPIIVASAVHFTMPRLDEVTHGAIRIPCG